MRRSSLNRHGIGIVNRSCSVDHSDVAVALHKPELSTQPTTTLAFAVLTALSVTLNEPIVRDRIVEDCMFAFDPAWHLVRKSQLNPYMRAACLLNDRNS